MILKQRCRNAGRRRQGAGAVSGAIMNGTGDSEAVLQGSWSSGSKQGGSALHPLIVGGCICGSAARQTAGHGRQRAGHGRQAGKSISGLSAAHPRCCWGRTWPGTPHTDPVQPAVGPKQQRCAELQCATAPHKWPGTLRTPPVPPANKRKKCHKCSQGCNVVLACCAHTATGPAGSSPTATGSTPFLFKCSIDALPHLVSLGVSVAKALPPVWCGALQANKTASRWSISAARQGSEPQQGAAGQAGAAPTAASGLRQHPQARTQQEQSMARLQLHG